jgi:hypothetical protein
MEEASAKTPFVAIRYECKVDRPAVPACKNLLLRLISKKKYILKERGTV